MKKEIRHRRLHAFYQSKVLNALMIVIIVNLLLMAYLSSMLLPAICGSLALLFYICYALWLWIKKPRTIIINSWLSNINGWYTLYFLIIAALKSSNPWWYITPAALAVVALFILLITGHDESFEI